MKHTTWIAAAVIAASISAAHAQGTPPQPSRAPQAPRTMQAPQTPQVPLTPPPLQALDTPKIVEAPKLIEAPKVVDAPKMLDELQKSASELTLKQGLVVGAGVLGGLVVGHAVVATGVCVAAAGVAGGYLANLWYGRAAETDPLPSKTRASAL